MLLFLCEILYSARSFTRAPGLTFALLLTISLGIGGNVAIQGFVRGLARGAPASDVVSLFRIDAQQKAGPVFYRDFLSLKNDFEWLGAARVSQSPITLGSRSMVASVGAVTPEIAKLLNLSVNKGVVISHRLHREGIARAGDKVQMRGEAHTISGVAREDLKGIYSDVAVDLWMPLGDTQEDTRVSVLGKLRPGAKVQTGELRVLPFTGMSPDKAEGLERVAVVLRAAAFSIFFIACANVAAFLLGRATARSHETSLRVAIGAGRKELSRTVLSDSIVVSVVGGLLGVVLAVWTAKIVPALLFAEDAERLVFAPDPWSIAAASLAGVAITIACGLLPLFATPHNRPAAVLRRESAGPSKLVRWLRSGLVIAQMACCCLLVVSTGILVQGLRAAFRTTVSQRLERTVLVSAQASADFGLRYFEAIEAEARAMRGVLPLTWVNLLPGSQPERSSYRIEPQGLPQREVALDVAAFTPDTLDRFMLPPKAGRLFGFETQNCRVAVVNGEAANAMFPAEPVGRAIRDPGGRHVELIGVLSERRSGRRPTIWFNHADRTTLPPPTIPMARFRAPVPSTLERTDLNTHVVSPSYFKTMGVALVTGSLFPDYPKLTGCRIALVNQQAADAYFGGKAVGASVIDEAGRRSEIIGTVDSPPLGAFQRSVEPAIYFPMVQDSPPTMTMIFATSEMDERFLAEAYRRFTAVPGRGPSPVVVKTFDTYLSQTALAPLRIATAIIGASAAIALLLSILGLYGTLDDAARRRGRELAIRIALGARRRHLIAQVLREGGWLAGTGGVAGVLASLLLARLLVRILPGGTSPALWVWLAGPAVLAGAVLISSILPARRASLVDPLRIMRDNP